MKVNLKSKNGITLVALIITIIVLLILAIVSIRLVMNGGIIDRAEKGTKAYTEAEIGEQIKLAYAEWQTAQFTGETRTASDFVKDRLNSTYGEGAVTNVTETEGVFTVTFADGKEYSYNATTGTAVKVAKWNDNGNNTFTHSETGQTVEVGDTVYYNSGVAAYEGNGDNQGKWGILGVEDGKLLIMSKQNVTNVELSGKEGYLNGSTLLNNACAPFKNATYADSARSIKIEDINKIVGYTPATPVIHSFTMLNNNVRMDNEEPNDMSSSFEDLDGKKLPEDSPILVSTNDYSYNLTEYLISGNKISNLLNDNTYPYYLNSQYVSANTAGAYWGFRDVCFGYVCSYRNVWDSRFGDSGQNSGVRAVISLKANIQLSGNSTEGWTIQ